MRFGEIKKTAVQQPRLTPEGAEPVSAEQAPGRALVALTPVTAARAAPDTYRQAPFLAQLIATKDRHPQTRERRRADPDEALASYRATVALTRFG